MLVWSGYHAIVTCYNGQTVAAQAGSQRLTVIGLTPVVTPGEYPTVAFNPVWQPFMKEPRYKSLRWRLGT